MKKRTTRLLILGIFALTGTLVSCNREDPINPDYNPETGEVNTQFVLSVSTGQGPHTKQSADAAQKNTNFYGIQDATLFAYATGITTTPYVNSNGDGYKRDFDLGILYTAGEITPADNRTSSSNRIMQLNIPVGTDAMLFYGKAITNAQGAARGSMNSHLDGEHPLNTYFSVNRRIGSEDNVKKYDATARLMIYAINTIMESQVEANGSQDGFSGLPALSWQNLGYQYEINNGLYDRPGTYSALSPLAENLGKAWSTFTYIKTGEYRAGSSAAVKKMMLDMYAVVKIASETESPNSASEANAKRLALEITDQMNRFFTSNWTYKEIDAIKNSLVPSAMTEAEWNNTTTGFAGAQSLNNYPGSFDIPDGAAQLDYDRDNDKFSYKHPNQALATPGGSFEPRKYVYPVELAYFVNSGLRVTDQDVAVSDYPNGVDPWDDDATTGNKWTLKSWFKNKPVTANTRAVAIRDNINYGVAVLETQVAWGKDNNNNTITTLEDNKNALTGDGSNNSINVSDAKIILKGILIGGAHPVVDWQYLPKDVSNMTTPTGGEYGSFDGVVYDNVIVSSAIPSAAPTYTLVFDNYDWNNTTQRNVRIALEFQNNGDDFWGKDNLIPSGGVFYLLAELSPAATTATGVNAPSNSITWPTYYQVPPIYETGDNAGMSKQIPRVFIQSFMTSATFRIGEKSLQKAYVTVPDLRSAQMSFGLSVDIEWKTGFTYDLEF